VFRGLATLGEQARALGVDMGALATAWVLHQPRVDAAIIGPRNVSHLESALSSTTITLSDQDAARLAALFETGGM
jgi:aryl-alcohol dehydrogenase-like predicted oxidoreductase